MNKYYALKINKIHGSPVWKLFKTVAERNNYLKRYCYNNPVNGMNIVFIERVILQVVEEEGRI